MNSQTRPMTGVGFHFLVLLLAAVPASAQTQSEGGGRYVEVPGWAVRGYDENGKVTAYQWYPESKHGEAMEDKAKMEKLQGTNGPIYARVTLDPEPGQRFVPNPPRGGEPPAPYLPAPKTPRIDVPPADPLKNSTWSGSEDLQGYGRLAFRFGDGGRVTMTDNDGDHEGRWQRVGNQVTLWFYDDHVAYAGRLNGNTLSGEAGNGSTRWRWNVARR